MTMCAAYRTVGIICGTTDGNSAIIYRSTWTIDRTGWAVSFICRVIYWTCRTVDRTGWAIYFIDRIINRTRRIVNRTRRIVNRTPWTIRIDGIVITVCIVRGVVDGTIMTSRTVLIMCGIINGTVRTVYRTFWTDDSVMARCTLNIICVVKTVVDIVTVQLRI